jgi:hypothetical protein
MRAQLQWTHQRHRRTLPVVEISLARRSVMSIAQTAVSVQDSCFAHVLVGEPVPTSPDHAPTPKLKSPAGEPIRVRGLWARVLDWVMDAQKQRAERLIREHPEWRQGQWVSDRAP